jgi:hypothetical protein
MLGMLAISQLVIPVYLTSSEIIRLCLGLIRSLSQVIFWGGKGGGGIEGKESPVGKISFPLTFMSLNRY